jgi:hypothetical protein
LVETIAQDHINKVQVVENENDAWRSCISKSVREVIKQALRENNEAALYRGDKEIVNRAMECIPPTSILLGTHSQLDAWMARVAAEVKVQIKNNTPKVKAEKEDEDRAGAVYYMCLQSSAKLLALASNESADLIARAAFPACSADRNAVFETYRRYKDILELPAMQAIEKAFFDHLLLEIIATRAERQAPVSPILQPQRTPI